MSRLIYGAPPGTPFSLTQVNANALAGHIELSYIRTKSIDDEPIYSDDGTEYLYTRRLLAVEGTVNATLLPSVAGETATITMARIKHLLEVPRMQLLFFVGNDLLFQSPGPQPLPGSVDINGNPLPPVIADAKWGPFPRHCTVTQIGGIQTYNVDYVIETFVQECPGQAPENPPPAYLSHRWSEHVSIDERFYSRRTRTGKIITRSDFYVNPDSLRGIVAPKLLPGFKRISSDYILQEDGLAMMYTVVDQEVFIQPPPPAVKAEGTYIESIEQGAIRHAECRVKLEGSKTDVLGGKARLLQLALVIIRSRLELAGVVKTGQYLFLKSGAIREELYDNVIEVTFRGMIQPTKVKTQGAAADLRRFCWAPIGSDITTELGPDPGERGTALLTMAANVLNDPCLQQAVLRTTGTSTLTAIGNQVSQTVPQIWQTVVLPDSQSILRTSGPGNNQDYGGVYTDYKINTRYAEAPHTHQLATCSVGAQAAFVQLAATTSQRVDEWHAERVGQWPKIPPIITTDVNLVYLGTEITIREVEPQADGSTPRYILGGVQRYGHADYTQAKLTAGVPPYVDPQQRAQFATLPPEAFEDGILDAASSQGTNSLHTEMGMGNLPTATIQASDEAIHRGQSVTISWSTTNAAQIVLSDGFSSSMVSGSGSISLTPTQTVAYLLFAIGPNGGVAQDQTTVVVLVP